ncbi:hypothetical protein LCGC14_0844170 [marine sediment metagenome]|uniref:Uncharacterized protein n=1 Tax=marine sediment metagenome TaxID=412755 RepID=A0A0F9PXG8_9ZZZZ
MFERTKNVIDWFKEHLVLSRIILGVVTFFFGLIYLGVIHNYSTEITVFVSAFMSGLLPLATTKKFWKHMKRVLKIFNKEAKKSADHFAREYNKPIERRKRAYDRQTGRREANRDFNKQEKNRKVSYKI